MATKKKKALTFDLSGKGPMKIASYITMLRGIQSKMLKKDGTAISKDSLFRDMSKEFKAFKKEPKSIRDFCTFQAKPTVNKLKHTKCPACGQTTKYTHVDNRISMFVDDRQPTLSEMVQDYQMRSAYANEVR